jgi:hypothetical protein
MSCPRTIRLAGTVTVGGLIALVAFANPPVIIVGGSIYGHSDSGWSNSGCGGSADYCVALPRGDSNVLSSTGYNSPLNQTVPNTSNQSWKVFITDKDSHGNENPREGVLLCGNSQCDPTKPSDLQHVYIELYDKNSSGWETPPSLNLYFIDKSDHCGPYYPSKHKRKGKCEHPSYAYLSIGNVKQPKSQCVQTVGCWIGVGNPVSAKKK